MAAERPPHRTPGHDLPGWSRAYHNHIENVLARHEHLPISAGRADPVACAGQQGPEKDCSAAVSAAANSGCRCQRSVRT
jgi:hypothetical protein